MRAAINRLFQTGIKSEFVKNTAKLTGGTAIAQIMMILASPILSRIYSPEDFGTFALYNSIVAVLLIVCTGRYDMGIVIAKYRKQALGLFYLSFIILLLCTLSSGLLIIFLQDVIAAQLKHPQLREVLLYIPITVFFLGAFQILTYWSNREKEFNAIALSKVIQNSVNICIAITLGFIFKYRFGLILGNLAGTIAAPLILWLKQTIRFKEIQESVNNQRLKYRLAEFKDFPKYSLPTAFLDTLTAQLPIFIISHFFTNEITGHYAFAYRILSLPLTFLGVSVGQVFFQKLTEIYHNGGDCKSLIIRTWKTLFLMGVFPMTILFLFGDELFVIIFGKSWEDAGKIASLLVIPLFFAFCSSPTSSAYVVFRIQHLSLFFGLMFIIFRPLAFYIGYLQDSILISLVVLAVVEIVLIVIYNIILLKKANRNEHNS